MTTRYEIQDILVQNSRGVVFHALDRESGEEVALRRFFPFGLEGGGFEGAERKAYESAVEQLKRVTHPALRKVLEGGTDPIDGMPFLVTEWHHGDPLSARLLERPLSAASAKSLADLALDCCLALSATFGKESIWIETAPQAIILGATPSDRPVTFWISPMRWLSNGETGPSLKPIVDMMETVTGWRGGVITDTSGDGLGWWLKKLRQNPTRWTLEEARNALTEGPSFEKPVTSTDTQPLSALPQSTSNTATSSTTNASPTAKQTVWPWILAGSLTLIALAVSGWLALRPAVNPHSAARAVGPTAAGNDTTEPNATQEGKPDRIAAINARAETLGKAAEARPLITVNSIAQIEGTVLRAARSQSDKTRYALLDATLDGQPLKAWVAFPRRHLPMFDTKKIASLKGHTLQVRGKWVNEPSPRKIILRVSQRKDIHVLPLPPLEP
ncbi:MAG: hypothetical protein ACQKBU_03810 [Verrucomicrobiales bacterium]